MISNFNTIWRWTSQLCVLTLPFIQIYISFLYTDSILLSFEPYLHVSGLGSQIVQLSLHDIGALVGLTSSNGKCELGSHMNLDSVCRDLNESIIVKICMDDLYKLGGTILSKILKVVYTRHIYCKPTFMPQKIPNE